MQQERPTISFAASTRVPRDIRTSERVWLNPKIITIFMLVFLCGSALGAAFTNILLHNWRAPAATNSLETLKERLQLTPDQQKVVQQELDDYAKYYQNIEEEREDVAEHGRGRILQILTPEQQKIFKGMFKPHTLPVNGQAR